MAARLEVFDCGLDGIGQEAGNNLMVSRTADNFRLSGGNLPMIGKNTTVPVAYDVLQCRDNEDPHQADRPPEPTVSALDVPVKGLRVGVLGGWFAQYAAPGILAAVDRVAAALGSVGTFELEYSDVARAAAFCITAAEAGTRFLPMLRARAAEFDPATRSRLMAGAMLPASVLTKAYNVRRDYVRNVDDLFETVDILLAPATPWTAPLLGQAMMVHCGESLPVRASLGLCTQPISFTGMPVVVVPIHRDGETSSAQPASRHVTVRPPKLRTVHGPGAIESTPVPQ
jgi:aspartyl-tRNA(Asn)/glutamyl-tRNA(Gln) amidotransferase subunit A